MYEIHNEIRRLRNQNRISYEALWMQLSGRAFAEHMQDPGVGLQQLKTFPCERTHAGCRELGLHAVSDIHVLTCISSAWVPCFH